MEREEKLFIISIYAPTSSTCGEGYSNVKENLYESLMTAIESIRRRHVLIVS